MLLIFNCLPSFIIPRNDSWIFVIAQVPIMATIEKQSWWVCFGDFGGCFKTAQRPPCILVWRGRRAEAALGFPWKLWSIFKLGINDLYYTVQDLLRELDVHSRRRQYVSRQSVDKEFPENRDFFFYFIVSSLLREKCKNGFVRIHDYRGKMVHWRGVNCHTLKFEDHSKNVRRSSSATLLPTWKDVLREKWRV